MMRMMFGFVTFFTMAVQWPAMDRYYGPAGIMPQEVVRSVARGLWRFSLIDYVSVGTAEWLYFILLVALLLVAFGIWTRWSLLTSIVLLFSFHEYGLIALDGGDTTLRLIGFILLISPCDRSFTLGNLWRRFHIAETTGKDQPPEFRTMPIWPYRLLLWQIGVLYTASAILKWEGTTWRHGEPVAIVLHHDMFRRVTPAMADLLSHTSPIATYFTLIAQTAWLLAIPLGLLSAFGVIRTTTFDAFKRALLLCGVILHGSIATFLDVGTFSFIMFTSYLGLLVDNDFRAIRATLNRNHEGPYVLLFDGRCGFCSRTVILLRSLDWLHRLTFVNFHDPEVRKKYAPSVDLKTLNEEMHVRKPNGEFRKGFYAFRVLLGELPLTWFFQPLFFLPGVGTVGEKVYQYIAAHRPTSR